MPTALFINGITESVLTEILNAQVARNGGESFLQPHKEQPIVMLKESIPTSNAPVTLYASTAKNLNNICYTAEIVNWEDKRTLPESRRKAIDEHLQKYQPLEGGLFNGINLLTIRNLQRLERPQPRSLLRKKGNGEALKDRTQPGGWSEVFEPDDMTLFEFAAKESEKSLKEELAKQIAISSKLNDVELQQRLKSAAKLPIRVQIVSIGFKRNPNVIVAVLRRSKGICEGCSKNAPFARKSDGTPFLEVHHRVALANGGEDTIENALALCPNCHRKEHHG